MEYDRPEYNIIESQHNAEGKFTWLRTNKIPLHNKEGKVIGILGTFEDITDEVEAEERLHHYEIITSTVDDMMAILDRDFRFIAVNNAYCNVYGVTRDDMLGKNLQEFAEPDIFVGLAKPNIEKALTGLLAQFESWREFPGSQRRYIQHTYYPVFDEKEAVTSIVIKLQDNTEKKKLEDQLQQAQKMEAVGRLAGGIAHDFNNILSVIRGYSDLCLMSMNENDQNRERVVQISEAGQRASRLTEQLLAFSRKQIIQPQPLNVETEVGEIYRMLKRLVGENIEVERVFDKNLWYTIMDRSQLEQVLLNLAVNARDAMTDGGKLTIEVTNHRVDELYQTEQYSVLAGDYVSIAMTDNGIGMSKEIQSHIFEPFFTTKPKEAGTGLGLSTVYGIVKQNKGYISVYSEEGVGTTFKLLFPRCHDVTGALTSETDKTQEELPHGSGTILLVEDDRMLRAMCVSILKDLGYTVLEAGNGDEALNSAERFHGSIDLLLTDVVMPGKSGPETARELEVSHPELKTLYMSGYTEEAIVRHGVLKEGINFVQKPITPKLLAQSVHKLMK